MDFLFSPYISRICQLFVPYFPYVFAGIFPYFPPWFAMINGLVEGKIAGKPRNPWGKSMVSG
jgi:hypothetical protein